MRESVSVSDEYVVKIMRKSQCTILLIGKGCNSDTYGNSMWLQLFFKLNLKIQNGLSLDKLSLKIVVASVYVCR